jgi:hypothetical protein
MSHENDEGAKVYKDQKQNITSKYQSLSIFITSSFTTTPLAINCSSIIYHSIASILVEGEYRPSLKDCLTTSETSSKAPTSTFAKTRLAIAFMDPCPRPQTLVENAARATPVFFWSLCTSFLLLGRRCRNKRQCLRAGKNNLPIHRPPCFSLRRETK